MHGFAATPDGLLYVFGGFYMAYVVDNQVYGGNERRRDWGGGGACDVEN